MPSPLVKSSKLSLILSFLILGLLVVAARLFFFSSPPVVSSIAVQPPPALAPIPAKNRPIEISSFPKNGDSTITPAAPLPPTSPADSDTQADSLAPLFAHIEQTDSLADLNSYLYSPNAELREAAKNAMIRKGDAAASPLLRAAAKKLSPEAAKSFLETATFLELPDYHEPPPEKPSASTP